MKARTRRVTGRRTEGDYSPSPLANAITAGYVQLARAIVVQALRDAADSRKGQEYNQAQARRWLGSEDGAYYAEMGGLDSELIRKWVRAGCPALDTEQTKTGVKENEQ